MTKNTISTLEEKFSFEPVDHYDERTNVLEEAITTMAEYLKIDNSIAVLSDLSEKKSYIFTGGFGRFFGMKTEEFLTIDSIWEEDIYQRIHPEDLFERNLLELEFFNFLKGIKPSERLSYSTKCRIRALNTQQEYQYILHRSFYLKNSSEGGLWLAVCLYNYSFENSESTSGIEGKIVNSNTGENFHINTYKNCKNLLTAREIEILKLISDGNLSKQIALKLNISINTVNRHRQNILEKLNVGNSIDAMRTAKALRLL